MSDGDRDAAAAEPGGRGGSSPGVQVSGDPLANRDTAANGAGVHSDGAGSAGVEAASIAPGAAKTGGEAGGEAGEVAPMDDAALRAVLEAVLLVADEPLPAVTLAQVVERPTGEVEEVLRSLADEYDAGGRGFELREVAGGWRYYTRAVWAPYVERFVLDGQQARLTQAALETLAVIAYRQPVSRARVSAVRGVNVDGVVRTLLARGLVVEAGQEEGTGATLYRTTPLLLEKLGLQTLGELPPLAPLLPEIDDLADASTSG